MDNTIEYELFETQNRIIKLQSEAINQLISILMQNEYVSESDLCGIKEIIDEAALLRAEHRL